MAEFDDIKFKAETTAVVVIEYQNEFCTPNGKLFGFEFLFSISKK